MRSHRGFAGLPVAQPPVPPVPALTPPVPVPLLLCCLPKEQPQPRSPFWEEFGVLALCIALCVCVCVVVTTNINVCVLNFGNNVAMGTPLGSLVSVPRLSPLLALKPP